MDVRRRRRLAGDGRAQAHGLVPLRVERGQRDVRLRRTAEFAPPGTLPLNINNFDNSKQQYFNLKGIWSYGRNWSFTGGYSYLKYSHDDVATNGYTYVLPVVTNSGAGGIVPTSPTSTSLSYGNGYDAYTDGHSNIFYVLVTYRFDAPPLPVAPLRVAEAPPAPQRAAATRRRPAAARAAAAGAEDHAGLEGAVRLRQGGAEARGQDGDRQPGGLASWRRSRSSRSCS